MSPEHSSQLKYCLQRLMWVVKRYGNVHVQGDRPNVFLFSTARSGSTWLMEMIGTQRGFKVFREPLFLNRFRHGGCPFPLSWEFLLPNPDREPRLEHYFRLLIDNRLAAGSQAPFARFHRFLTNRIVFSILRCKDLMNWFEERFEARIVYLVRHPMAVSLSRTEYGRLPLFLASDAYCERFLTPRLRSYGRTILAEGSELQKKTLDWCLQNVPPLRFLDRSRWVCVHYEDLVVNPAASIARLADELELDEPEKMLRQAGLPSVSVRLSDTGTRRYFQQSSGNRESHYLVSKWRKTVSAEGERRAFEVLEEFGIDTYAPGHDMPVRRL